jgi:hypothetical protein
MIAEAQEDAQVLRQSIHVQVDTGVLPATETAKRILDWLEQAQRSLV